MIVQLSGTLVELTSSHVIIDVAGVGYELGISASCAAHLPAEKGSPLVLLTRMIVKENALELYGFADAYERLMFDTIISISGVGPKLALAILSLYTPSQLLTIAQTQDVAAMSQVSGVGKKKAQRLLLELADMCARTGELQGCVSAAAPSAKAASVEQRGDPMFDARAALASMGFTAVEIERALEGCSTDNQTAESLVAQALRSLARGL
ncbi:Holliday junction DNA helicase RuvA [Fannyhessea vaginae PB189-T1-4]|jgi:hypothetical protein|uniref:Holliday junction branch migration complex subunit RuvA n=1 Tax=Fannyhessea vaginae PB189-T1-4 TaxID=866774 RepID=A0ABN0AZ88_9ACTN|nr:Holliday junction branch migration protein RuvA [Fannyhessea vaginae]EFL43811.1 Holliday junction DNA helicase RuvA [Fannyhessea vaginae PB189-T1-4]